MNRPYLSADLRRAGAVATVIELAASHDPAAMTTGQIAAAMGVSQGALFRHFPDKAAIWTAVLEWTAAELNLRFDALPEGMPLVRLEALMAAHMEFVVARPGVPRILFGELQRAGTTPGKAIARQLMAGYRARVARELSAAQQAGDVLFLAMIQGLVMQSLAVDDFTTMPALAHRLFALFRQSLGAPPCE